MRPHSAYCSADKTAGKTANQNHNSVSREVLRINGDDARGKYTASGDQRSN